MPQPIELTEEEIDALMVWLAVLTFSGNTAELKKALGLHDEVLRKLESARGQKPPDEPTRDVGAT